MSAADKTGLTDKLYDIAALGEALIDFTEAGRSPSGMRLFEQNPGGAPANLLGAAARFGARTAFIGKVGLDMHGRYLKSVFDGAGIDTRGMILAADVFTTMAFVTLTGAEREFSFARRPGADTRLTAEEVDFSVIDHAAVFHFGSLSLTDEPARSATYAALRRAREAGAIVSYDPNYRPALWPLREEAISQMRAPLPLTDIVKLSEEEALMLSGCGDAEGAALALGLRGIHMSAVTLGEKGALVCRGGETRLVPGYGVDAVDTTGAGDAFGGAFLYKLLASGRKIGDITLENMVTAARFANAAAAICVSRRGGMPSLPSLPETEGLMADGAWPAPHSGR